MIDSNILESKSEDELKISTESWTNVQVDSQVLSTFMSCARKADYVFNRHLVPISGVSYAIERGQLAHIGLHSYWKSRIEGSSYQDASLKAIEVTKEKSIEFKNLDADNALQVYQNLIEYFRFIQDLTWTPLFVEQHFKFIAYENPDIKLRIILTGRIDLGFRTPSGMIIPVDNKTESERWHYSNMSNQFRIYCLACKSNTLGIQRFGFQKTLKPEEKFKLELLTFDPDILNEFRDEILPHWAKQLLICKEDNYWPMNTSSCIHGHFACQFSDKYNNGICSVSRKVREQKLSRYFTIGTEWNPADF